MNILKKIIWYYKNKETISLTLKGIGGLIIMISGLFQIGITPDDWQTASQAIIGVIVSMGIIISSIATIWGLIRKFL